MSTKKPIKQLQTQLRINSFAIASPFVLPLGSQTSSPSWALLQPARWALPGWPAPACSRQQQAGAGLNMRTYATSNYILLSRKKLHQTTNQVATARNKQSVPAVLHWYARFPNPNVP